MTTADKVLLDRAVSILRALVAARPPAGMLHFGLFALARLLEEIAREHPASGRVPEEVARAALEIARHIVDHGIALSPDAVPDPTHQHTQEQR